jgi:tetratricopeptide (TPR) repeat protein
MGLEYRHWDKALKIPGQPNWQAAIKNGIAMVTLAGHAKSAPAAEALIERDLLFRNARDIDVPRVRHALSLIFPGENDGLAGLEPDLIGEHHVAGTVTDALVDACLDWAREDREQRRHILAVLNRATRPEHGAKASRTAAQLERLLRQQVAKLGGDLVKVALETPGRLLDLCPALEAQLGGLDEPALAAIDAELPLQSLTMMELSLRVAELRVDLARKSAADAAAKVPPDLRENVLNHLASRAGTLGVRLSNLGRREEALAATQEAVDIRRRLAQTRPDAFLPDLAGSISVMSDVLAALDRHGEAAQAAIQALEILAPYVERYPQTYRDLARTIEDDILRCSEAAGQQPDNALLAQVAKALGNGEAVEEDSAIEALKARIDAIVDAAMKAGALDEGALAELPSGLAEQLRAAWAAAHAGSDAENPGG